MPNPLAWAKPNRIRKVRGGYQEKAQMRFHDLISIHFGESGHCPSDNVLVLYHSFSLQGRAPILAKHRKKVQKHYRAVPVT